MISASLHHIQMTLMGAMLSLLLALGGACADVGDHPSTFDDVAARIAASQPSEGAQLGASITPEGHWRLANRAGERMTAADQTELTRALAILLPSKATGTEPLSILLAEEALYRSGTAAAQLPDTARLHVLVAGSERRAVRNGSEPSPRIAFELRPRLLVTVADRNALVELDRLLAKPLDRARILALETSGGGVLPPRPPKTADPSSPAVEAIDPERVVHALHALARQTVIVTGRIEGDRLHVRPASGSGRWLPLASLIAAARAADIDLVIVTTASGRQPGGRNWLWQRVEVRNLQTATARPSLADFISVLGGDRRLSLEASQESDARLTLKGELIREASNASWTAPVTDTIIDLAAESIGSVQATGLHATLLGNERRDELARRIVPGIPSRLQFGYLAMLALGLIGWPVARGWWMRVWPPEQRTEYASRSGYMAAVIVRQLIMVLAFVPLVAPFSVSMQAVRLVRRGGSGPAA